MRHYLWLPALPLRAISALLILSSMVTAPPAVGYSHDILLMMTFWIILHSSHWKQVVCLLQALSHVLLLLYYKMECNVCHVQSRVVDPTTPHLPLSILATIS